MSDYEYADVDLLVREWLTAMPSVANLVPVTGGGVAIYQAPPRTLPAKLIVAKRVGGSPIRGSTVPTDRARVQFDCWAANRPDAAAIAKAITEAVENLAPTGGFLNSTGRLASGEVASWLWLPDPTSDKPRYVVDASLIALAN